MSLIFKKVKEKKHIHTSMGGQPPQNMEGGKAMKKTP